MEINEQNQAPPEKHHNLGDTLGIIGLAVTLITWALAPAIWMKALAVFIAALILVYLAYRSHFTRNLRDVTKHILAAVILLCVILGGGWHLWGQWRSNNQPKTVVIAQVDQNPRPQSPPQPQPQSLTPVRPVSPRVDRPAPKKKPSTTPDSAGIAQPAPSTQGSPTTNNCPNGICISGGIVDHPEVNNFGPPPLKISWRSRIEDPKLLTFNAKFVQSLIVESNVIWTPVSLAIICDGEILGVEPTNAAFTNMLTSVAAEDNKVGLVRFTSPVLAPGAPVQILVLSNTPVTVKNVVPTRITQQ